MKKYLHYDFTLTTDDIVEVNLSSQTNVLFMDEANITKYRKNRDYSYIGGFVKATPFRIRPPKDGHWHIVIEEPKQKTQIRAAVRVLKEPLNDQSAS